MIKFSCWSDSGLLSTFSNINEIGHFTVFSNICHTVIDGFFAAVARKFPSPLGQFNTRSTFFSKFRWRPITVKKLLMCHKVSLTGSTCCTKKVNKCCGVFRYLRDSVARYGSASVAGDTDLALFRRHSRRHHLGGRRRCTTQRNRPCQLLGILDRLNLYFASDDLQLYHSRRATRLRNDLLCVEETFNSACRLTNVFSTERTTDTA